MTAVYSLNRKGFLVRFDLARQETFCDPVNQADGWQRQEDRLKDSNLPRTFSNSLSLLFALRTA
jgi:hypothetical protein